MQTIFDQKTFLFPYNLKFPGQHTEERILFITREGELILKLKLLFFALVSIITLVLGINLLATTQILGYKFSSLIPGFIIFWLLFSVFIAWWIKTVFQKSLFIITTRRLTKFVHTTPWSRYQMSLGLDHVVDTGAYTKGWFQMFSGLSYFVARSSAGAVKNFKIINITFAEDLHNYLNKLLYVFNDKKEDLDRFRPFIPHLKGEARDNFVRATAPQFSKPIRVIPELDEDKTQYLPPTN